MVSREELRERLWPQNTFVEFDASLRVAVGKLREALGDSAQSPHYIETVPRHGYRLIASVQATANGNGHELKAAFWKRRSVLAAAARCGGSGRGLLRLAVRKSN